MSDYPPRVGKSERIYQLWESGEGDMGELAIGLYDLTAHYKALWDDYAKLKAENERLRKALNLIAVRGEGQDASSFDNYWYSEYAYATAEKALGGES